MACPLSPAHRRCDMKLTSKTNASTARWDFHRWQPVVGRALWRAREYRSAAADGEQMNPDMPIQPWISIARRPRREPMVRRTLTVLVPVASRVLGGKTFDTTVSRVFVDESSGTKCCVRKTLETPAPHPMFWSPEFSRGAFCCPVCKVWRSTVRSETFDTPVSNVSVLPAAFAFIRA